MGFERHYGRSELEKTFRDFKLPEGFLFGVGNSGYQSEGGYNRPGEPLNNWVWMERSGRAEVSGDATRFWTEYPAFIELAGGMGLNCFRLGVDWSRVQPSTSLRPGRRPPFDSGALEGYARILAAMMSAGMEPMVTLQMFTHPAWLGREIWLEKEKVGLFLDFVGEVAASLNTALVENHGMHPVKYWITINEPNILAILTYLILRYPHRRFGIRKCGRAWGNMLGAHCRAYDTIHDTYSDRGWKRPSVTFNTGCASVYLLEKVGLDIVNARLNCVERKELPEYLEAGRKAWDEEISLCPGVRKVSRLAKALERALVKGTDLIFDLDDFNGGIEELYASPEPRKMDFLAIDVYDPFFSNMVRAPTFTDMREGRFNLNAEEWQWVVNPRVLYHFLKAESINGCGMPVMIAENGMAYRVSNGRVEAREDGVTRDKFLQGFLFEAARALADGVPLAGYLHWTLVDTYEWGRYEPRFGLYTADREVGTSPGPVDAWGVDAGRVYADLIAALRSGDSKEMVDAFSRDYLREPGRQQREGEP